MSAASTWSVVTIKKYSEQFLGDLRSCARCPGQIPVHVLCARSVHPSLALCLDEVRSVFKHSSVPLTTPERSKGGSVTKDCAAIDLGNHQELDSDLATGERVSQLLPHKGPMLSLSQLILMLPVSSLFAF